jgi:hypothetical protein
VDPRAVLEAVVKSRFPVDAVIFVVAAMFRPNLGCSRPSLQLKSGNPSLKVKWPEREGC